MNIRIKLHCKLFTQGLRGRHLSTVLGVATLFQDNHVSTSFIEGPSEPKPVASGKGAADPPADPPGRCGRPGGSVGRGAWRDRGKTVKIIALIGNRS